MKSLKISRVVMLIVALVSLISFIGCELADLNLDNDAEDRKGKPVKEEKVAAEPTPPPIYLGEVGAVRELAEPIWWSETIYDYEPGNSPETSEEYVVLAEPLFFDAAGSELENDESVAYYYMDGDVEVDIAGPEGAVALQIGIDRFHYLKTKIVTEWLTGWYSNSYNLWAGQDLDAGSVTISNDSDFFYILIDTNDTADLQEAHIYVYEDVSELPEKRPAPGQAPYTVENIYADTVEIAIPMIDLVDLEDYYFIIHAALVEDAVGSVTGESNAGETAYAGGQPPEFPGKGSWFYAVQYNLKAEITEKIKRIYDYVDTPVMVALIARPVTVIIDPPAGVTGSQTSYAYDSSSFNDFLLMDFDEDGKSDFKRWGWSNGPYGTGTYTMDIYAGAGQSDITKGTLVGELTVVYDEESGSADVEYTMNDGFYLGETHLYIGNEILASDNGSYTVAPGQYSQVHEGLEYATSHSHTFTDLSGEIYVVAHAVVYGTYE